MNRQRVLECSLGRIYANPRSNAKKMPKGGIPPGMSGGRAEPMRVADAPARREGHRRPFPIVTATTEPANRRAAQ